MVACSADCALAGWRNGDHARLYARGDYDLAGFCVGVVERKHLIDWFGDCTGGRGPGVSSPVESIPTASASFGKSYSTMAGLASRTIALQSSGCDSGRQCCMTPTQIYARPLHSPAALQGEERGARNRPHHRRRLAREHRTNSSRRCVRSRIRSAMRWDCATGLSLACSNSASVEDDEMYRVFNMGIGLDDDRQSLLC